MKKKEVAEPEGQVLAKRTCRLVINNSKKLVEKRACTLQVFRGGNEEVRVTRV